MPSLLRKLGAVLLLSAITPALPAASSISHFGITWTFDRDYPSGRFANGDPWVVGPVTIVAIDPPSEITPERTRHGSMVNPDIGDRQGYDSSTYGKFVPKGWDPSLNVARAVSTGGTLRLPPGSSLISTISHDEPGHRPQLKTAAILTVLPEPAPAGAFRPPYVGNDKTLRWHVQQMDLSRLQSLRRPRHAPNAKQVAAHFERPWIEQNASWTGGYLHPSENQPDYGRDMANQLAEGLLLLHLDLPQEQKRLLLIRLVQYGIDIYGAAREGAVWVDDGGHNLGRKAPLLLAGVVLGDEDMLHYADARQHLIFQEDRQTWYVGVSDVGRSLQPDEKRPREPYQLSDVGLAEWGEKHTSAPKRDARNWNASYRNVTGHAMLGHALFAHLLQAEAQWNHPAFFDYAMRYWQREKAARTGAGNAIRPFVHAMWTAYGPEPAAPKEAPPHPALSWQGRVLTVPTPPFAPSQPCAEPPSAESWSADRR